MPEPMGFAQRCIDFRRSPAQITMPVNNIPVLKRNVPILISYPADIAVFEQADIGKHERIGLICTQFFDNVWKIVNVAGAAGTIKPELNKVAIVLCKFV